MGRMRQRSVRSQRGEGLDDSPWKGFVLPFIGIFVGGPALGLGLSYGIIRIGDAVLDEPCYEQRGITPVERGSAVTSKLETVVKDLDGDGKPKEILKYNGKYYFLKADESGKPVLFEYEAKKK